MARAACVPRAAVSGARPRSLGFVRGIRCPARTNTRGRARSQVLGDSRPSQEGLPSSAGARRAGGGQGERGLVVAVWIAWLVHAALAADGVLRARKRRNGQRGVYGGLLLHPSDHSPIDPFFQPLIQLFLHPSNHSHTIFSYLPPRVHLSVQPSSHPSVHPCTYPLSYLST